MSDRNRENPWKGLNFYVEGEVLYGRSGEIESLSQYIINNSQTVLYGKSGIGKSSILNAGIFPIARKHGMTPVGIRLDHGGAVPYLAQIKEAIRNAGGTEIERLPAIDPAHETLWEYLHRNTFVNEKQETTELLLVFDQFEEIFTLQKNEKVKEDFFRQLADLLNGITPAYVTDSMASQDEDKAMEQITLDDLDSLVLDDDKGEQQEPRTSYLLDDRFHIVITLREDFLSYLERYTKYIPVMRSNRYALQPINEEQAKDIIMMPIDKLVDQDVAKLIIQKVTGRTDFELGDQPEIEVDAAVLSLYLSRLYMKKGKQPTITTQLVSQFSDDIIKDFYEESVADLPAKEVEEIEDQLLTYDGRRNNVSRNDLLREGISEKVIRTLVEDRKLLRQFSYQGDIRVEFMHDILCHIVDERTRRRADEKEKEAERQQQDEERRALERKNRKRMVLLGSITAIMVLVTGLWWLLLDKPFSNDYAGFTTCNGWPQGLGPKLEEADYKQMVVHYRLTRRGLLTVNPYSKVEVLNRYNAPATNILVESPLVSLAETDGDDQLASRFASMQLRTSRWEFTKDANGHVSRQTAYDLNNEVLYSIEYYHEADKDKGKTTQNLWMNYVDPEGKALRVRDNGADRMRVTQKNGYCTRFLFFNDTGTPQENSRHAFGYKYEVDDADGHNTAILPLDEYGDTIQGQSLRFTAADTYGRWTASTGARAHYSPNSIVYSMGERTDSLLYDDQGRMTYRSEFIGDSLLRTFAYDAHGHQTRRSELKTDSRGEAVLLRSTTCVFGGNPEELIERTEYHAEAAVKYQREVHELQGDTHAISYYSGHDLKALQPANKEGKDYGKEVTRTTLTDSTRVVEHTYYAVGPDARVLQKALRREVCCYDSRNDLLLRKTTFVDGRQTLSIEYEIEDNMIVGQHVLGLKGDTIRCPQWDDDGLCYYRRRLVYNFAGDIVATKAINEFGEESMITYGNNEIKIMVVPGTEIKVESDGFTTYGNGNYKYSFQPVDAGLKVEYVHITDTLGAAWQSGLRDADIVLSRSGSSMKVARRLPQPRRTGTHSVFFETRTITLNDGERGMDTYPVYYTKSEMQKLKESISHAK